MPNACWMADVAIRCLIGPPTNTCVASLVKEILSFGGK